MNLEGRIDIRLSRHGDRLGGVEVRSSRPQVAQKLMFGRTPEEAAQLAGTIFSLCGRAQGLAARAAGEAAQGITPDAEAVRMRDRMVLVELALEHAWRLLLNWPEQAGQAPDMDTLLALRRTPQEQLAERLDASLGRQLLGETAATWLQRDLAGLDAWRAAGATPLARLFASLGDAADIGTCDLPMLPSLAEMDAANACELARAALADPAFCARPTWHGQPAETGAVARVQGHPLMVQWLQRRGRGSGARLLARLIELAQLPTRLAAPAGVARTWQLAQDSGVAGVETSRGLLLHVVRFVDGRVADYRIIAPTEWNFHPQGPLVAALSALPADERLGEHARQIALALDPCVAYDVEIVDA